MLNKLAKSLLFVLTFNFVLNGYIFAFKLLKKREFVLI